MLLAESGGKNKSIGDSDHQYKDTPYSMNAKELEKQYRSAVDSELAQFTDIIDRFSKENWLRKAHVAKAVSPNIKTKTIVSIWDRSHRFNQYLDQRKATLGIIVGSCLAILIICSALYSLFPQEINYSFASKSNCIINPEILPNNYKNLHANDFNISRSALITIDHNPILTYKMCVKPKLGLRSEADYLNKQSMSFLGIKIVRSVKVATGKYATVQDDSIATKAVPIDKPISFKLSQVDNTFNYEVIVNGKTAICKKKQSNVECNLSPLNLAYQSNYTAQLVRTFNSRPVSTVISSKLQTITATAITDTSVAQSSIVYDKPQQIVLSSNKQLVSMSAPTLTATTSGGISTNIPIKASFKDKTITVNYSETLPRSDTIDLHISKLISTDQSGLEDPYNLIFKTSGGPSVSSINLPSYGVASGQNIVLTFDQPLLSSQDPSTIASLVVNGTTIDANYSISGSELSISPNGSYPVCASIKVELNNSAVSNYGISGNSGYTFNTRSHCYTTFSIGTSVEGRPITAYKFGSGSSMVLYIAAMEGNERNSSNLLQQWIPDVDANPQMIPSYRTLVIIPAINPDGYAADTRLNAHGVDLNRNFPANNWSEQVTEPLSNTVMTNDGGPNPLSEPESQALATFYEENKPRLAITEHSHGGIVEANDAGDSIALGQQYAKLAGYYAIPTYEIGNFFDYTTTGAFEDWANNKLGLPVLEVELQSSTNDEYSRNLPALWAMANVSP